MKMHGGANEYKALEWVMDAADKNGAVTLSTTLYGKDFVMATDGVRLQAIPRECAPDIDGDVVAIDWIKLPKNGEHEVVESGVNWPDLLPRVMPEPGGRVSIYVDVKTLISTIEKMGGEMGYVRLRFGTGYQAIEVFGRLKGNIPAYALIMPMAVVEHQHRLFDWRPGEAQNG